MRRNRVFCNLRRMHSICIRIPEQVQLFRVGGGRVPRERVQGLPAQLAGVCVCECGCEWMCVCVNECERACSYGWV